MNDIVLLPIDPDFKAAARQHFEHYGSTLVANTYLKIALFCLSLVALGLIVLNYRTFRVVADFKPVIIRINDIGRAEAIAYSGFNYKPQAPELKYFLIQFVTGYYGRIRATARRDYPQSLLFLEQNLAQGILQSGHATKWFERFLAGEGDEVDIQVNNVTIEDLREPPYKANVAFDKIYYSSAQHIETRREHWTAHFVFIVRREVVNNLVPYNPLGITIQYFREDQAFN